MIRRPPESGPPSDHDPDKPRYNFEETLRELEDKAAIEFATPEEEERIKSQMELAQQLLKQDRRDYRESIALEERLFDILQDQEGPLIPSELNALRKELDKLEDTMYQQTLSIANLESFNQQLRELNEHREKFIAAAKEFLDRLHPKS